MERAIFQCICSLIRHRLDSGLHCSTDRAIDAVYSVVIMSDPLSGGEFLDSSLLDDLALEDAESTASDNEEVLGPVGYDFEPIIAAGEDDSTDNNSASGSEDTDSLNGVELEDSDDGDLDPQQRLGNTNWCDCQNCGQMHTAIESVCCKEMNAVQYKLNQLDQGIEEQDHPCITMTQRFHWICVDSDALEVAMLSMADVRAENVQRPINSR